MTQRLIYVIGPSGAGKDSVLDGLRKNWGDLPPAHWARRTITRDSHTGEAHESVSTAEFDHLLAQGAFALQWQANGLCYGVRHGELTPLDSGHCVFLNGSRAHLSTLLSVYPQASVVLITASAQALHQRLMSRSRETQQEINQRLAREITFDLPDHTLQVHNNGALEDAVHTLRQGLEKRLVMYSGQNVGAQD
jgi:ribose 1,5-bisphosphokinase